MIIGIDPGIGGGVAILNADGQLISAINMPTITTPSKKIVWGRQLAINLKLAVGTYRFAESHAWVEAVASRPRQAGVFQFGLNTGVVHGVLGALGIEFTLVAPAAWKASHGLKRADGESQADQKTAARELASRLWPDHAKCFSRVKDDGVAEAALIALHGYYKKAYDR